MFESVYIKDVDFTPAWIRVWMDNELVSNKPLTRIDLSEEELFCPKESDRCWVFEIKLNQKAVS